MYQVFFYVRILVHVRSEFGVLAEAHVVNEENELSVVRLTRFCVGCRLVKTTEKEWWEDQRSLIIQLIMNSLQLGHENPWLAEQPNFAEAHIRAT